MHSYWSHGFDLIVVEHRLRPSARGRGRLAKNKTGVMPLSGANLIQRIVFDTKDIKNWIHSSQLRHPLVIGMSAYLEQDEKKLLDSGADMVDAPGFLTRSSSEAWRMLRSSFFGPLARALHTGANSVTEA